MYLMETHEGEIARERCALSRPFGPALKTPDIIKVEIWGTSINDPGDDYVEFRVTHENGSTSTHRVGGY